MPQDIAEAIFRIEESGSNTVYFIGSPEGRWSAHVRDPAPLGAGAPPYVVARDLSLSDAIIAAASKLSEGEAMDDWKDLL